MSPEVTNRPSVIPKRYKLKKSKIKDGPNLNIETPKKGAARSTGYVRGKFKESRGCR